MLDQRLQNLQKCLDDIDHAARVVASRLADELWTWGGEAEKILLDRFRRARDARDAALGALHEKE